MIIRIEDPSEFVGLTLAAARQVIAERGYDVVVVRSEGVRRIPEGGYDPLRVKLWLKDGRVEKADIG